MVEKLVMSGKQNCIVEQANFQVKSKNIYKFAEETNFNNTMKMFAFLSGYVNVYFFERFCVLHTF
jgi:hypothetical protein